MLNWKNGRTFKLRRQFLDTHDVCHLQFPYQMHIMSKIVRWLCVSYRFENLILTTYLYWKYTKNRFSRAFTDKGNLRSRNASHFSLFRAAGRVQRVRVRVRFRVWVGVRVRVRVRVRVQVWVRLGIGIGLGLGLGLGQQDNPSHFSWFPAAGRVQWHNWTCVFSVWNLRGEDGRCSIT
jgi:NF-X1-type zinc finger protein NFXL1